MADTKITDLSELTTINDTDVLPIVDDTSGTPVTKKAQASTLREKFDSDMDAKYRAMQLYDKMVDIGEGTTSTLKLMTLGDSLGYKVANHIADRFAYAYGGTYPGKYGKVGEGLDGLTYALDGSGSEVTDDFDYWITGVYSSLSSGTSDALRAYADGAQYAADQIKVYYIKEPGAGTFKVQTSTSGISSGFADEVGYTAIDCDDTLAGAVVTIDKTAARYAVKVVPTSGTVKIIGVGLRIAGEPGFELQNLHEGGIDVTNYATTPSAIVDPIFTDLAPDVIIYQNAENNATSHENAMDALYGWLDDNSLTSTVLVVGEGPKDAAYGGDAQSVTNNATLREKAETYGWLFLDLMDTLGSLTLLTSLGWNGDDLHLDDKAYQYAANIAMARYGWPDRNFARVDRPITNLETGDDANLISDVAFVRDPFSNGVAGHMRVEPASGSDVQILLGRWLSIRDSDGSNEYLRVGNFGYLEFHSTMGDSTLDPTTDAPADWVHIKIGGTEYYLPAYAAS